MAEVKVNGREDSQSPVGMSQLGTVVFDNIVFPTGTWLNLNNEEQKFEEVRLDAVAITCTRTKNIVSSSVTGKSGTNKEYISTGDFEIDLTAIISPKILTSDEVVAVLSAQNPAVQFAQGAVGYSPYKAPHDEIRKLRLLDDCETSVKVLSKILNNDLNINNVVVDKITITKADGDSFGLQMRLLSDRLLDLGDFG